MKKRGIGFASSAQGVNYHFGHEDSSTLELQVETDGSLLLCSAASDIGQGLEAVLIRIAAMAFNGYPAEKIRWEGSNTRAPDAGGTGASRQSTLTGNACYRACEKLKALLQPVAAEILDSPPDLVEFWGEQVRANGKELAFTELCEHAREMGITLSVTGSFTAPQTTELSADGKGYPINQFGYATHMVEVEVDTSTGEVSVLRVEAFHDSGIILNPIGAAGQVEGATVMGMGFALSEDYLLSQGKPVNLGFTNYIIPSLADAPEINVHFLGEPAKFGELGVKGLAEVPTSTIAPAIINAIYNATGGRVRRLPATPERVLEALGQLEDKD